MSATVYQPTVYMVQPPFDGAPVKIGFTNSLRTRLRGLQTGLVGDLKVIRQFVGRTMQTERWLHKRFQHCHLSREWFEFDPQMLDVEPPDETGADADVVDEGQSEGAALIGANEYLELTRSALQHAIGHRKDAANTAAKRIGCSARTIENILSGAHAPSGTVLLNMMAAYPEINAAMMAKPLVAHWRRLSRALAAMEVAKQALQKELDAVGIDPLRIDAS